MTRVSNAAQSAQTQRALLAAARALFAERGYGATSAAAIVARAGVTRGALHYHFQNKAGPLLRRVYRDGRRADARRCAEHGRGRGR